jgi:iron complex transport system ATP-binding protein
VGEVRKGAVPIIVDGLNHSYGRRKVLHDISFEVGPGEFIGVIGPNGSGKSTLLGCITGVLDFRKGRVSIGGMDVRRTSSLEIARMVGVVPQETSVGFEFTVQEVVLMGRYPHIDRFALEAPEDLDIADEAMRSTNTHHLSERLVTNLSGGEKQRVIIARALAQEPKVLLLDEPTSHLDIRHQLEVLNLIKDLNTERGLTVMAVFHDLNLASRYCDRLLLMHDGRIMADGPPKEVLTRGNIAKGFEVTVSIGSSSKGDVLLELGDLTD